MSDIVDWGIKDCSDWRHQVLNFSKLVTYQAASYKTETDKRQLNKICFIAYSSHIK